MPSTQDERVEGDQSDLEPPTYFYTIAQSSTSSSAQSPPPVEHIFQLTNNGRQWLTLILKSRAPNVSDKPSFTQGSEITGSVRLNLDNKVTIRSVTVSVFGQLSYSDDVIRFFSMTKQLLVSDTSEVLPSSLHPPTIYHGKLKGEHSWPFSIRLPKGVCIVTGNRNNYYDLPASLFTNKAAIRYCFVTRIKKGIMSSSQRLNIPFEYTPLTRPNPPSVMRQISYLERTPLIGPEGDHEGWEPLPEITIRGTAFHSRPAEISCILSLARPLCYTRGSIIPLSLSISATDSQALALLSAPTTPQVQLLRKVAIAPSPGISGSGSYHSPEVIGTAEWWSIPDTSGISQDCTRYLQGEINVPKNLEPNCHILSFTLEYEIALLPPKAVAFSTFLPSKIPLRSKKVEIMTVLPQGPQPLPHSPPVYATHDSK